MKKILEFVVVVLLICTVGILLRGIFLILRSLGKIRIANVNGVPKLCPGTLVLANHRDLLDCMYETELLPAAFFPQYALHHGLVPRFTLDAHNFTDKWYWAWLRPLAISIYRGENRKQAGAENASAFRAILYVLRRRGGVVIHFPEGGRTCTAEEKALVRSKKGKQLRALKPSVGRIVKDTNAFVLLVWLEQENSQAPQQPGKQVAFWPNFGGGNIIVRFGKIMRFNEEDPVQITKMIQEGLLTLADQE